MAGAAAQEEKYHRLGFGGLVRLPGREWICSLRARLFFRKHGAESQSTEATEGIAEKFPSVAGYPNMLEHDRPSQFTYKKEFRFSSARANSRIGCVLRKISAA